MLAGSQIFVKYMRMYQGYSNLRTVRYCMYLQVLTCTYSTVHTYSSSVRVQVSHYLTLDGRWKMEDGRG